MTFNDTNKNDNNIQVIEWYFPYCNQDKIQTSKEEVLEQVLYGLELINSSLKTNYKIFKMYFSPCDSARNSVYTFLILKLIRDYHSGNKFKEI